MQLRFISLLLLPAVCACDAEPDPRTTFNNIMEQGRAEAMKGSGPQRKPPTHEKFTKEDFDNLVANAEKRDELHLTNSARPEHDAPR